MTDLRRSTANGVLDATRVHQQQQQQQQSQQQSSFRDSFSMPEPMPKSLSASNATSLLNGHPHQHQQQQQQQPHLQQQQNHNPLHQGLSDHGGSISGGSTTSSTATTATAATVGRNNWNGNNRDNNIININTTTINGNGNGNSNGNGNGNLPDMPPHTGEMQFDEREIYYVAAASSPTPTLTPSARRKGSFCAANSAVASTRSLRACERLRSVSPTTTLTTTTTIAPTYPATLSSAKPYYGSTQRTLHAQRDMSFDSYEISSHYSDTAMQALRSGSSSSSLAAPTQPQTQTLRTQNSVTFSNYVSSQYPSSSGTGTGTGSATGSVSGMVMGTGGNNNNRGSLRRAKGRSNQSLCSCDAGDETEINPDPTRPLYQYSLERSSSGGQKMHTYTCEQNAQILMRLERERNRRLSLGGTGISFGGIGGSKDDVQSDTLSSSDVDVIPPVPPPPAMKRNGSMRSLRLFQQHHQQQQHHERPLSRCSTTNLNNNINNTTTITNNASHIHMSNGGNSSNINSNSNSNNNNAFTTLCSADLLADCTNSTGLDVSSVIDDCTTSILKCANVVGSEIMATTTGNHKPTVATLATIASSAKPDVCRVGNHATTSFSNYPPTCLARDDIFIPSSKKSDPALCFLHAGPEGIGPGPDLSKSQRDLQNKRQSKYNTIGPSSDYMRRQLLQYNQKQQQLQHHSHQQRQRITERCRCFSQSLSNFSRDYFGQQHQQQQQQQQQRTNSTSGDNHNKQHQQQQHIFHTSGDAEQYYDWMNSGHSVTLPPPPPVISRSYSNLFDIDGRQLSTKHMQYPPYQKFQTPEDIFSSSCSFGTGTTNLLNNTSFTTLNSSANSGLKEKLHQQQQQQQLHHHIHRHDHHLPPLTLPSHHQHHKSQQNHHHQLHHHQQLQHQHQQQQQQQQHLSSSTLSLQQQHKHQLHSSSMSSIMPWKHRQCPSRGSSSSGTNSFRFDAAKHWLAVSSILLIIGAASVAVPLAIRVAASAPFEERLRAAVQLLDSVPLIDGHNDLPWNIRKFLHNKLNDFNFDEDLRNVMPWARSHWSHTDLQRLKKGRVSAQFWAAYVPCEAQHRDAVQLTLEQIDVIKRLTDRYSPQLTTCTSSNDILEAHKNQQLCSLTGVEGGHSLGGSLAVLRTLYAIGVRYMTLTSTCHTPWADSSYADAPTFNVKHGGLTIFGKTIIREMNRLGMMVDLSHVSTGTMRDALEVSEAPVIFSHSSAYELCNSSRNVQDDMLQSLAKNGGLVMVNFYSKFLSCSENATVHDAVAHINHIKRIAGIDHVGLGAGYDGINFTPKGLEDVSSYPTLFAELLGGGWSSDDLTKLAGGNFLRVMQQVEKIRDEKKAAGIKPYEDHPNFRTDDPYNCTSS